MSEETYTNRQLEEFTVGSKSEDSLVSSNHMGCSAPREVLDLIEVGDTIHLETKNGFRISGFLIKGNWYAHKSDQQIEREDTASIEASKARHLEYVEKNKQNWLAREMSLPEWAQAFMVGVRQKSTARGENFDTEFMGWGYTLVTVELAVRYTQQGESFFDQSRENMDRMTPDSLKQFMNDHGMSGNQVDWALAIANRYLHMRHDEWMAEMIGNNIKDGT